MVTLYGIPNCDSVKKARAWLAAAGVPCQFHDYKKQGVPQAQLDAWMAALGWHALINQRGTTWRGLAPALQAAVQDQASAKALMLAHPSVIKRPVVEWGTPLPTTSSAAITLGFDPARFTEAWQQALANRPPGDSWC